MKLPACYKKFALLGLALSSFFAINAMAVTPVPRIIPPIPPILTAPEARIPVRLDAVNIVTEINGSLAHTVVELRFYNPNERVLEGQLEFPLDAGQSVSGFALDINGKLRPAVVVDKARGQQVFEDVTRARVDPALLEVTRGNHYRLRLYPLPAKGTRTVQLTLEQVLISQTIAGKPAFLPYTLPLQFGQSIGNFDAKIKINGVRANRVQLDTLLGGAAEGVQKLDDDSNTIVQLKKRDFSPGKNRLELQLPVSAQISSTYQRWQDKTYFYAEVPLAASTAARPAPKQLAILWDASGSGANRDHGRELAALDAYFAAVQNLNVQLIVVRDKAEPALAFAVHQGNWQDLRRTLDNLAYDGASNSAGFVLPENADFGLVFSDGIMNYGNQPLPDSKVPVYALLASTSADQPALRAMAENSGGQLLNLLQLDAPQAVKALRTQSLHLLAMQSVDATQLVSASVFPEQGRLRIAGVMQASTAKVMLNLQTAQGQTMQKEVVLSFQPQKLQGSIAARRWADLQLARLQQQTDFKRAEIRRLGREFSIVTAETSLIVLDAVQDYVRYEITPPEELRADYEQLLAQKAKDSSGEQQAHLDKILARFSEKQAWWNRDFPKTNRPQPPVSSDTVARPARSVGMAAPVMPAPMVEPRMVPPPSPALALAPPMMTAEAPRNLTERVRTGVKGLDASGQTSSVASITMKKWEPDAPYYRRLQAASVADMYRIYLDERPAYVNSSAFFLDAADLFMDRGQTGLGLRILSNLAEMQLENRHILRLLAYRLIQAKQPQLAIPVLQTVQRLSPEEPQSYRDLGLAYAEAGQPQAAIDQLWQVVRRPWHDRFPDIELIALAEMNAIIARQPATQKLDTSRMDTRFLRNLPLDLRAVMTWDADNTDIDLWVTDPNGEKTYYASPLSYQGGRMSRDFTGGYGPEEFSLRTAKPGKYRVEAQFFGHRQQLVAAATTLMLRLSTGFGTANQKDNMVVLRLNGQKDVVLVGEFEIVAPAGR